MRLNYVFCKLEDKFAKEILSKCREAAEKFYSSAHPYMDMVKGLTFQNMFEEVLIKVIGKT